MLSRVLILVHLISAAFAHAGAAESQPRIPMDQVAVLRYEWHDAQRSRDVPVKIYYPVNNGRALPIIIFSHGLGGNREGYEYLGRHWAGCGYVSLHLQHRGSDDAVWKNAGPLGATAAMFKSVADISNAINRARDVSFALDQIVQLNMAAGSPLRQRLDVKHIGMAGHSFGGWTTMAIVGERLNLSDALLADSRITAAIEMSAPVPRSNMQRNRALAGITTPVFHMTGTLDDSPMGETKAAERRVLFDAMGKAETCLVIFNGADHMTFAGHLIANESDARFQPLICAGSTAFFDAYLRKSDAAKTWLYDGGFSTLMGGNGTFEGKRPHN